MTTYHYSVPPPGWPGFEYTSTSPSAPHYSYYTSPYSPHVPRPKRHSHRTSYGAANEAGWYPPPGYVPQNHYDGVPDYMSPPRKHEPVSAGFGGEYGSAWKSHRRSS